jgi:hypothetical protein
VWAKLEKTNVISDTSMGNPIHIDETGRGKMAIVEASHSASYEVCDDPVGFTEIWLMLMLMLKCCERKNNVHSLKSTAEVVQQNRAIGPRGNDFSWGWALAVCNCVDTTIGSHKARTGCGFRGLGFQGANFLASGI